MDSAGKPRTQEDEFLYPRAAPDAPPRARPAQAAHPGRGSSRLSREASAAHKALVLGTETAAGSSS